MYTGGVSRMMQINNVLQNIFTQHLPQSMNGTDVGWYPDRLRQPATPDQSQRVP